MPIVPIAIALAVLLGLLVAAIGPALRIAQRRASGADLTYVPVEWQRAGARVTGRRFVPAPAPDAGGRVTTGERPTT